MTRGVIVVAFEYTLIGKLAIVVIAVDVGFQADGVTRGDVVVDGGCVARG